MLLYPLSAESADHFEFCAGTDGPLSLEPSSSVLHYAQTLFEGLKAYRDDKGKITLFRPDMNMKRMNASAARIGLPVRVKTYNTLAMDTPPPPLF